MNKQEKEGGKTDLDLNLNFTTVVEIPSPSLLFLWQKQTLYTFSECQTVLHIYYLGTSSPPSDSAVSSLRVINSNRLQLFSTDQDGQKVLPGQLVDNNSQMTPWIGYGEGGFSNVGINQPLKISIKLLKQIARIEIAESKHSIVLAEPVVSQQRRRREHYSIFHQGYFQYTTYNTVDEHQQKLQIRTEKVNTLFNRNLIEFIMEPTNQPSAANNLREALMTTVATPPPVDGRRLHLLSIQLCSPGGTNRIEREQWKIAKLNREIKESSYFI